MRIGVLVNMLASSLLLVAFFLYLKFGAPELSSWAGRLTLVLSLTPQFFHVTNARTHGLSARPVGMLLFFLFFVFVMTFVDGTINPFAAFTGGALTVYLIFGFNAFAQQAVLLISILMVGTGHFATLGMTIGGLLIFVAAHPRYSMGYLRAKVRHLSNYRCHLAPEMLFTRRPSIWRDLWLDIPSRIRVNALEGVTYAYRNSALIVIFLNPLTMLLIASVVLGWQTIDIEEAAAISGFGVFLLTSLRPFRFLGEPERYVEIVTPLTVIGVSSILLNPVGYAVTLAGFILVTGAQVGLGTWASRNTTFGLPGIAGLEQVRECLNLEKGEISLLSNNNEVGRAFLDEPWRLGLYWHTDAVLGSVPLRQIFAGYPYLSREAIPEICASLEPRFYVHDKRRDLPVMDLEVVLDTETLVLYRYRHPGRSRAGGKK